MQTLIIASTPILADKARALAHQLGMAYGEKLPKEPAWILYLTPDYLSLINTEDKKTKPFYIDFNAPSLQFRKNQAKGRNELIRRALGIAPTQHPNILDATFGLGRDSYILAALGYTITGLERSVVLGALIRDALARSANDPILQRITFIETDAKNYLSHSSEAYDIIYLDPMFPERRKSAAVKKEMAILQALLGMEKDDKELLQLALSCAKERVVVKRPRYAPPLGHRVSFSIKGPRNRFDVYLVNK